MQSFVCAFPQIAWIKVDTKAILAIHDNVITNNGRLTVTKNDKVTWTLHVRNSLSVDAGNKGKV